MTVFTSEQFGDGRPPVVPENAGYEVVQHSEVLVPATLTLNDILRLGKLPPNCVLTDVLLQCDGIDTNSVLRLRVGIEQIPTDVNIGTITVTTAPDTDGDATVTLDGAAVTVALLAADNEAGAATKIAAAIDALAAYTSSATGAVVTVTRDDGQAVTIAYAGGATNSVATISGPEDVVANSWITAGGAYPIAGAAERAVGLPYAILQNADNLALQRNIVAKVTVEGTARVAGTVRMHIKYRAVDFGL